MKSNTKDNDAIKSSSQYIVKFSRKHALRIWTNLNNLFANIRVLLLLSIWHESGSRLILESYERGIPVIAFDTGGNSEIMKNYPEDIFEKPIL